MKIELIDNKKVILDIAHNPQSVSFLKENLKKYYPNSEFIAVFSALEDKNVCSMIEELNGIINQWNISEINNERKTTGTIILLFV